VEYKLFDTLEAGVSTFEFHEHRERAPHLEQPVHQPRLSMAYDFIRDAADNASWNRTQPLKLVDLGCGDGGLLSRISRLAFIDAEGFDFQPSNKAGWEERNVTATALNFVESFDEVPDADIYVITECLEHLTDPHDMLAKIATRKAPHTEAVRVVASSPWTESDISHDACHAWAWDEQGYRLMFRDAGFKVERQETIGMFQVILGVAT
jgi:2-polyprenyl-3-methyl-5-hydroxy-6-metoxy-1,4-benzoquinol methylase